MTSGSGSTAFVTDADGFVGREVVRLLLSRQRPVFALTGTREGMARLHEAGARPVLGELLTPGPWQDEAAAADWVFHLPPYTVTGRRMTRAWAAAATRDRVTLDGHLLDTLAAARPRRIVYVSDASAYGPTGPRPVTEDEPLRPTAWGRCHTPAFDRVDGYLMAGLPIVTALPGWIYGNGGWFRASVIDPVLAGRRVPRFGSRSPWVSAVHVHDCARALVHLAEHGEPGGRYFVTDGDPIRFTEFATRFAALGGRRLRVLRLPASALGLMVGPVLADHLRAETILSNIRLRSTGFRFCHPTLDHGIEQVLGGSMRDDYAAAAGHTEAPASFDEAVLPHLRAGYRLARSLTRDDHDAEDIVQEASLRALRYFRTFAGGNARAWFLRIVRNTAWTRGVRRNASTDSFGEEQHSAARPVADPEALLLRSDSSARLERALDAVPARARTLLVLREQEGLSYRELADVMGVPIGTIMSGLSRARQALRQVLITHHHERAGAPAAERPIPDGAGARRVFAAEPAPVMAMDRRRG